MQTDRFETFMDAILAIIITVLVLKLAQPPAPTWDGVLSLNASYLLYGICFLIIFNTWYNDHNLFQMVDEINNLIVVVYGVLIFIISLLPYFASWVSLNPQSVPAQTMFGILFLATNACYNLSTFLIIRANPYNAELKKIDLKNFWRYVPVIVILIGFLATYTVYTPGIFISCIIATIYWFFIAISTKSEIESSGRFEALFDAIIAIILTVLVLEITMASGGTWQALFDLKIEFLAYIISFIVCFNYWNYNNNLFSIVNKIDTAVIWSIGASMFVLSLACYGIDFIVVAIISIVTSKALKNADRGNVALMLALRNNLVFVSTIVFVGIGMVIGYFFYPPAIIISCLLSIIAVWAISYLTR